MTSLLLSPIRLPTRSHGMPPQDDSSRSSDSSPNFDWLHQHDQGSDEDPLPNSQHDSAVDMLPPELEPVEGESVMNDESTVDEPPPTTDVPQPRPAIDAVADGEFDDTVDLSIAPDLEDHPEGDETLAGEESDSPSENVLLDDAPLSEDVTASPGEPPPEEPTAISKAAPVALASPAAGDGGSGNRRLLLIILASYASAATIALVYLITAMSTSQPHTLESLPDVDPLESGERALVPIDAVMAPGHTLKLGESCRYGNILVEPLGVIEEPIEFVHFLGSSSTKKPATDAVFKLRVRFTNVSQDQTISPLDRDLVFSQVVHKDGRLQTNQFVIPSGEKSESGEVVYLYPHPLASEWDLVGQNIATSLAPGESVEMFLPTETSGIDRLVGDVLWRIHFRKGYSPKGYGVTTVIEVAFESGEVVHSFAG